jgi:type I restriction enzyme R subunit
LHYLTDNLRKNITIDWSKRESMQVRLRLMVKRILRKYKYPPYMAEDAVQLLLSQAENLGDEWV